MTLLTVSLVMLILCLGLIAAFFGTQVFGPVIRRLAVATEQSDSLTGRVLPLLAFVGLLAILTKITVF